MAKAKFFTDVVSHNEETNKDDAAIVEVDMGANPDCVNLFIKADGVVVTRPFVLSISTEDLFSALAGGLNIEV